MKTQSRKRFLILFLIVLLLLVLSLAALLFQHLGAVQGQTADIYQDGTLIRTIDLNGIEQPYTFTLEAPDGGYNTIRVEDGKIGVVDTDCPDKVCQNTGMISDSAYPITCLPHRLVIQIEKDASQPESIDSIAR